ncbi:MAG: leucine-rich repeat domain-containing protein, partial [Bacteroidaceae bacterium]|nr:leucine-rich repeat domain-containing protein [Bacteroidaceae bacterium]
TTETIPHLVLPRGISAFSGCSGLTSVTIPNSVMTIGDLAFCYCSGLTSVTIPNSVMTIGDWAFSYCSALKDFYCHAESVPTTDSYIFYYVNLSSATLHVPEASLQEYGSTAPWSEFGQIVALTESDGIKPLTSEEKKLTTVYSLDGRRVAKSRKGIYVIGGRKTVVR